MAILAFPVRRAVIGMAVASLALAACSSSAATPGFTFGPAASSSAAVAVATVAPTAAPTPVPTPTAAPTPSPAPPIGFTPGTVAAPRVVEVSADDNLNFTPGLVQAAMGETVTFKIHNKGKAVHEFMVGALADAFADKEGTPEVADIGPNQTGDVTFTIDGTGPFGFACHAPGHFEHGMAGYIQLVGPGAPQVGTKENPRVVGLNMDDNLKFVPGSITVAKDESIRFVLTNSGKVVHEFQVGSADKVAADEVDGVAVVEKDELDEGSTHAVNYTFTGPGPFAFACHEPGHYEAGMTGTIEVAKN